MRSLSLLAAVVSCAAAFAQPVPSELQSVFGAEKDLKFSDMFPRRSYLGKTANAQGWSHDDRYFAYTWNDYKTRGMDLWLYDSKTGKTERLTSIDMMAKFDRDAKAAIDFFKKEDERLDKWDTLSDTEWRVERQKLREEREKPGRKADPSYPGVGGIEWANKKNEFLMTYRGDVWRWKVGEKAPTRLTQTRESESSMQWLPDDSGFVFQRGTGVYRIKFGSEFIRQISPEMPEGVTFSGFQLSPDGKQMLVYGNKAAAGQDRQVDYIVYRNRFAEARKTSRGVSEDEFRGESLLYLFDITDTSLDNVDYDQKPFEIYKWAGGEEWQDLAISNDAWAPDSSAFVFASWKRDKKELLIQEAVLGSKKVRTLYTGTSDGEHQSPGMCDPFYSGDGKTVYGLLDKSGWRHLHSFDRTSGSERQITSGDFEVYPLKMAADKKSVLVRASKENLARMNLYRVDPTSGAMTNLTAQTGMYGNPDFANKSDNFAVIFNSWSQLRELYIGDGKSEKALTESHRSADFWKVAKLKPELFQFKNRHGDTVSGFLFTPPNISAGGKRPLWMYVYGGPLGTGKSVVDGSFGSTDYMFNQYLAYTMGYVTAVIDPRGSSGYNARFGKSNFDNPGVGQTEDLADAAKYLASRFPIDTTKVGLNGWSFGGWQTQHAMYHAPETFTLGIAGAGPTEWQNYNTWYTGGVIGNTPKGKGDYLDKFSLTKVADKLQSPLLLLHGIEDTNVLFQDTIAVYRKLLQAGKGDLVELSLDPTGGHGMGGDMDTRDRHMIYLSFILRHWGGGVK